ncbi:MAG: hypothetical protein U1F87_12945 [Kiritimatiellia bacterium]
MDLQIEAGIKAIMVCEPAATVYFSKQLEVGADTFDRYVSGPQPPYRRLGWPNAASRSSSTIAAN